MVFISLTQPLEEFLKIEKEKRLDNLDWFLFDRYIKDKSLTVKNDLFGHGNSGNLECYMSRIYYYPLYYKKPLYCYLMTNSYFNALDLLPKANKNSAAIWNMSRVPETWEDKTFPRNKEHEKPFMYDGYEDLVAYMRKMFTKLTDNNFSEHPINFIVLGSEKSLKETSDNVYNALNIDKNHHNENTHILVENAYEEYISKGGTKELQFFKDTLDVYLINGYCGY